MTDKLYRLCYVSGNTMYFTDNFENQTGDDWDDAPYEHNAGEPYDRKDYHEYDEEWCINHGCGNIRKIAFDFYDGYNIKQPKDGYLNSPFSVERINQGEIAWLYNKDAGALGAGAKMSQAKRWLKKAGVMWGELHE